MLMASYVASTLGHGDSGPVLVEGGLVINDLRDPGIGAKHARLTDSGLRGECISTLMVRLTAAIL